jgi:transposase-like protein
VPEHRKRYSQEYREEAVKMVIETSRPIAQVARELGIVEGTVGNWVNATAVNMPARSRRWR